MRPVTPQQARAYLAGLALANEFEIEELRRAPVELKLRQLWALMTSAHLFADDSGYEAQARDEVRRRWFRLHQSQGD